MLIIGAGGLAAQIFPDIEAMHLPEVAFWSEYDTKYSFIKDKYSILKNDEEVVQFFKEHSRTFILAVGQPAVRRMMAEKFTKLGGKLTSYISPFSTVSPYSTIAAGATILSNIIIEPGTEIREGCLLNKTSNVGHGCTIGDYSELAPAVILTGEVELGQDCYVGTGTIILPKVKIGKGTSIAAGAVVKKNIPEYSLVAGGTATIIKSKTQS